MVYDNDKDIGDGEEEELFVVPLAKPSESIRVRRVEGRKYDVRVWLESERYTGPTKRGFRLGEGEYELLRKALSL